MSTTPPNIPLHLFNQGYFDKSDPTEGIGTELPPFSLYQIYHVGDPAKVLRICEELYTEVSEQLSKGGLGYEIEYKVVNYQDAKHQSKEKPREYILIKRETTRRTRITVLARFLGYGDKLYVAVDSYVLGTLDLWAVVWRAGITLIPLSCTFFSIVGNFFALPFAQRTSGGEIISTLFFNVICCLIPWTLLMAPLFWIVAIRNYRQEQDLGMALRQSYNRIINGQSFNIDDILMTIKSLLPLILFAVRDVLKKNGLDVKVIDAFAENIMTVNNIQNIFGNQNAIAGAQGTATTNIGPRPS